MLTGYSKKEIKNDLELIGASLTEHITGEHAGTFVIFIDYNPVTSYMGTQELMCWMQGYRAALKNISFPRLEDLRER